MGSLALEPGMLRHIPDFPVAGRPLRKLDGPMKKDAINAGKHDIFAFALHLRAILKQSTPTDASYFQGFAWILMDLHGYAPAHPGLPRRRSTPPKT